MPPATPSPASPPPPSPTPRSNVASTASPAGAHDPTIPGTPTTPATPPAPIIPSTPPAEFLTAAAEYGIEFDEGDVEKLALYLALLLAHNETTNLTAITDVNVAWMRHILDSLTLLPLLADLPDNARIIDVGSGGGLPGLPLAICMPSLRFTLLEATGKKAQFLRITVKTMGLTNVTIINERAETLAHDRGTRTANGRVGGHREAYDAVIARAVGRIATLAELTVPFATPPGDDGDDEQPAARKPRSQGQNADQDDDEDGLHNASGEILLIKGAKAEEEIAEAKEALHLLKALHDGTVVTPTGKIVVISKGASTPRLFPRRDGEPKRSPLGVKAERET